MECDAKNVYMVRQMDLRASDDYCGKIHIETFPLMVTKAWWSRLLISAGLMPTEARGNYLPYIRETKTYLNCIHASESTLDNGTSGTASHSSRHDMLAIISFRYQYGPFLFFCCISYVKLLDYWRAEKNSLLPEAPWGLRPVAFATSATWLIRHCYYISRRQTTRGFELAENSRMCDYTVPGK